MRDDVTELGDLPVTLSHVDSPPQAVALEADHAGRAALATVPLGALATLDVADYRLNQISRDDGKRRIVVGVNVRGRDLGLLGRRGPAAQDRCRSDAARNPPRLGRPGRAA